MSDDPTIVYLDRVAERLLSEIKAANYGARVGQTIAGRLTRGAGGRFSSSGAAPSRGSVALVREARQQARQTLASGRPARRGGGRSKGRTKKPKPTAEERRAQKEQERQQNREAVFGKLQLDGDVQASLLKLSQGDQPDGDVGGLVDSGLAVQGQDGAYRLTPQGRALMAAASRGDAGRARDALSLGKDRAEAARAKAEKQKKGKGGKGAKPPKPTRKEQQAQNRQQLRDQMAADDVGLAPAGFDALLAFADGGELTDEAAASGLLATGLIEQDSAGEYRLSVGGRQFVRAAGRGDKRAALDALSRALDRLRAEQDAEAADEGDMSGETKAIGKRDDVSQADKERAMSEYGDVAYADEKNKKYPIDAEAHIRAAWNYINKPDNAAKYSASEVATIKRKIVAAWKQKIDKAGPPSAETKGYLREGDDVHPGAMVAFLLDDAMREALLDATELADDEDAIADHVTLVYLAPDAADLDAQKNAILMGLAELAADTPPIEATVNGYGRFNGGDGEDGDALYVNVDSPDLPDLYDDLTDCLEACGCEWEGSHGFTPHITLAYLQSGDAMPDLDIPALPLTFDRIALVWAGETITFPLGGTEAGDDAEMDGSATLMQALGATPDGAPLPPDDTLIYRGGEVKSLGGGHVGGYLVLFGDPNATDLAGDFFTPETDFGIADGQKTAVYLNHRLPLRTRGGGEIAVKERIGEGTLRRDKNGVLIDAILYNREQYEEVLKAMGWSSGTASHLVDRQPYGNGGKAAWLKTWPLGLDASLTPGPCEPRAAAIPLKSYVPLELTLDTKSADAPETAPEPARSAGVRGSALKTLVTIYLTAIEHDIKAQLERWAGRM